MSSSSDHGLGMDDISSCDDDPGSLVDSSDDEAELVYGFPD